MLLSGHLGLLGQNPLAPVSFHWFIHSIPHTIHFHITSLSWLFRISRSPMHELTIYSHIGSKTCHLPTRFTSMVHIQRQHHNLNTHAHPHPTPPHDALANSLYRPYRMRTPSAIRTPHACSLNLSWVNRCCRAKHDRTSLTQTSVTCYCCLSSMLLYWHSISCTPHAWTTSYPVCDFWRIECGHICP
jgi:hypothetical protein